MRQHVAGEDADDALLRLLARVSAGAQQARASLRQPLALDEMRVRIGPERPIEDVGLHGPRDHVNGHGDAPLAPVRPQTFAQDDQAVALVVDAREEALERLLEREEKPGLDQIVLLQLLGQEHLVRRRQVRRVHAEQRGALHLAQPDAELEEHRGRLREADIEVPPARIEDPGRQGQRKMQTVVRLQRDAWQRHGSRSELLGHGFRIMGTDDCDFVTTPTQFLIQEACLKHCAVGVRDPRKVTENRDAKRPALAGGKSRERRGMRPVTGSEFGEAGVGGRH